MKTPEGSEDGAFERQGISVVDDGEQDPSGCGEGAGGKSHGVDQISCPGKGQVDEGGGLHN